MKIDLTGENIELGRNDEWIFYKNRLTSSATQWAKDKWKLRNVGVLYAEEKKVYGKFAESLFEIQPDTQTSTKEVFSELDKVLGTSLSDIMKGQ